MISVERKSLFLTEKRKRKKGSARQALWIIIKIFEQQVALSLGNWLLKSGELLRVCIVFAQMAQ